MYKTDNEIIEAIRNKDEKALTALYDKYYKLIYFVANNILNNYDDVEEVVNDTFLSIYNNIDSHEDGKSFKYWMLQIAKNNALQLVHKKSRDNDKINKISLDTEEHYEETYIFESLKQILSDEEYYVFVAKTIHNLTYVEIGLLMGVSKSNVCRIYQGAIKKLRENL